MIRALVVSTMAFMCIAPVVLIIFDLMSVVAGGG